MLKQHSKMDPTLVTASMYTIGGITNIIVVLNIIKRWTERTVIFAVSFSIGAVCLLTSCGKAIYDIYQEKFTPFESKVFLFWYTGQLHLITNLMLILTVQRFLTVVVRPYWVHVTVTRRGSDKNEISKQISETKKEIEALQKDYRQNRTYITSLHNFNELRDT